MSHRVLQKDSKVYVAGHTGMAGSAILRKLHAEGFANIITRNSSELDLRDQGAVQLFFQEEEPEYIFLAAARVGGIGANSRLKADFLFDNLTIQTNVIHNSHVFGAKKLLFLGSSCIYPKHCPQPMKEEHLMTGPLEPTNDAYAIAKISGIKMCQAYRDQYGCNFISVMPTNLYGPNDNYDLETGHVLAALIRKFVEASEAGADEVVIWGNGEPKREFLHAADLADACLYLMRFYNSTEIINVGVGKDLSIIDLAEILKDVTGFKGQLKFDQSKPNGTPRKLMDVSKIHALGWSAKIPLNEGISKTVEDFKVNREHA